MEIEFYDKKKKCCLLKTMTRQLRDTFFFLSPVQNSITANMRVQTTLGKGVAAIVTLLFAFMATADDSFGHDHMLYLSGEFSRWNLVTQQARKAGLSLAGFYHTSAWQPNWQEIVEEQLLLMDGRRPMGFFKGPYPVPSKEYLLQTSHEPATNVLKTGAIPWDAHQWASVLDFADHLHVTFAGQNTEELSKIQAMVEALPLKYREKIIFRFNQTLIRESYKTLKPEEQREIQKNPYISEGEYPTLVAMHDYCMREKHAGRHAAVWYLHNKGACCVRTSASRNQQVPVASWREFMNSFNIEFPSICLRAMLAGYSTCGVEYQEAIWAGNFYWAHCDHIAALPRLWTRFDAWAAEPVPFNVSIHHNIKTCFAENCAFSAHKCRDVDHYRQECPRDSYRHKIARYIIHPDLPRSTISTADPPNDFQNSTDPRWANITEVSRQLQWMSQTCGKLRQRRYEEQPFWNNENPTFEDFPLQRTQKSEFEIRPS